MINMWVSGWAFAFGIAIIFINEEISCVSALCFVLGLLNLYIGLTF